MTLRNTRYPIVGESILRASDTLFNIGMDISERQNRQRYASQSAKSEAQGMKSMNSLYAMLDEDKENPDTWLTKTFPDWFKQYEKDITEGITDPRALNEIRNNLPLKKEIFKKSITDLAEKQENINSNASYDALNLQLENTEYPNELGLQEGTTFYTDKIIKMIGTIPRLQTPELARERIDINVSRATARYLINNPHKTNEDGTIDEDYWINHPNEFAETNGLNSEIGRDLFTAEEKVKLKSDYQATKSSLERIDKEELEAIQEKNATDLYLGIRRGEITDPTILNTKLEKEEITRTVHEKLYNLLSKGSAEQNDPESLMSANEAVDDVRDGRRTARDAFEEILGYSTKLTDTTFDSLIPKLFPTDAAADPMAEETTKTYVDLLKDMRKKGKLGSGTEAALNYNKYYRAWEEWVEKNPDTTPEQKAKKFDEIIKPIVSDWFEKWIAKPFRWQYQFTPMGAFGKIIKGKEKEVSPYEEYPDAFLENGVWKVIKDGKKYRIED